MSWFFGFTLLSVLCLSLLIGLGGRWLNKCGVEILGCFVFISNIILIIFGELEYICLGEGGYMVEVSEQLLGCKAGVGFESLSLVDGGGLISFSSEELNLTGLGEEKIQVEVSRGSSSGEVNEEKTLGGEKTKEGEKEGEKEGDWLVCAYKIGLGVSAAVGLVLVIQTLFFPLEFVDF